ncbi:MAG: hypothetical protein O9294_16195 [Cytophagales bacterium]|nr:hypothetical protein [Cytophagales bacterium]
MLKTIVTALNILIYIYFLSYFFDISIQSLESLHSLENSIITTTKLIGIVAILIGLIIFLFLIYLFSIGLGGQLNSFKEYFVLSLNGFMVFNFYYAILFLFFEKEILDKETNHYIFEVGKLTYLLFAIWIVLCVRHTTKLNLLKSILSVLLPSAIIVLFKVI